MNEFRVSSINPPTAPSWSAEEEANRLMDDVFSDIDSLLSGKPSSAKLQTPPSTEYTSLQSVVVPQIDLTGTPFATPSNSSPENLEIVLKRGWGYYTERLFFMGSCATFLGVVLWMAVNERLKVPQFLTQPAPVAETATTPTAIAENSTVFANYVQRALDSIDRQGGGQPIPVTPQTGAALAPEQNPAAGQSPQVIERIYIPVYPPDVAANGTQPNASSPTVMPKPPAGTNANLKPAPQPKPATPPNPARNTGTTPVAIAPPPPPMTAMPALPAPPAASKTLYTLAGVLSGNAPTVLVKINDTTQRYRVGETIGGSNWTIISAQDTQVILGQGGQTKTIYIGESFSVD